MEGGAGGQEQGGTHKGAQGGPRCKEGGRAKAMGCP